MIDISPLLHQDLQFAFLNLSQSAASALVSAVWQGALVAGTLAVCLRIVPRTTASLRFALWASAFVLVAGLPFLPALQTGPAALASAVPSPAAHVWLELDLRWSLAITALWALASLYRAGDLAMHCLRLRKLWSTAVPVSDASLHPAALVSRWQGGRTVELCTTDQLDKPSVIGFFRPRILIPSWLLEQLPTDELNQIVLHEMEHLRRRDDWTNLLQKLSLVIFPINPVLLWMERRLCREREMACDDGVIRVTQAPKSYAVCLANLAERGMAHRASALATLALGAWQRRPELVERVHSVLRRGRVLGPVGSRALAGTVGCALVAGAIALSRCPQLVGFRNAPSEDVATVEPAVKSAISFSRGGDASFRTHTVTAENVKFTSKARTAAVPLKENLTANLTGDLTRSTKASSMPSSNNDRSEVSSKLLASRQSDAAQRRAEPAEPTEIVRWTESVANAAGANEQGQIQDGQIQGYVVLTTWEEDLRPATNAVQSDMAQPVQPVNAERNTDRRSKTPAIYHRTVTQMIFRVVPTSFDSILPANSPTLVNERGGWLVFQL